MSIKRIKDETKLIVKWKLKTGKSYYFHVFLWEDQDSFDANTCDNKPNEAAACVNLAPTVIEVFAKEENDKIIIRPKLGEIHFIKDKWNMEVVAHELCHAFIHRIRQLNNKGQDVIEQIENVEESVCYEFGQWAHTIYNLLWKENPSKKWKLIGEIDASEQ